MSCRTYGDPVELPRARVEQALRAWSAFPVDRVPRPLVLVGSGVVARGFPDGQTKRAFGRGAVDALPGFPGDVLEVLRSPGGKHDGSRLLMTAAVRGMAGFATDRGRQQLPAWEVHVQGVPEPIEVLDPVTSQQAWWPSGFDRVAWQGTSAVLSEGGVTMQFTGTPFAYADYFDAEVLEEEAAVAIIPTAMDTGPPGPRPAYAQKRRVSVALARPLGARVLLDQHGAPVMVLVSSAPSFPQAPPCLS